MEIGEKMKEFDTIMFAEQIAELVLITELAGGRINKLRLSSLFMLLQKNLLCQFGCGSMSSDKISIGDQGVRMSSLFDLKIHDKSTLYSLLFNSDKNDIWLTDKGVEMTLIRNYDDPFAIYGYLCEEDENQARALVADKKNVSTSALAKEVGEFFGDSNNEFLTWEQIIKKNDHWDVKHPELRPYLLLEMMPVISINNLLSANYA